MRMGEHRQELAAATADADRVYWFQPQDMDWSLDAVIAQSPVPAVLARDIDELVRQVAGDVGAGDQVVIMSNGGFGGIHQKLLARLGETEPS
jgi:UDP-N-acetylmuramate: L-alanyl-gamma-D-glutamyl-meso-diaminopimelate ligase